MKRSHTIILSMLMCCSTPSLHGAFSSLALALGIVALNQPVILPAANLKKQNATTHKRHKHPNDRAWNTKAKRPIVNRHRLPNRK